MCLRIEAKDGLTSGRGGIPVSRGLRIVPVLEGRTSLRPFCDYTVAGCSTFQMKPVSSRATAMLTRLGCLP